ncbi:MAG TPA: hydrolase [Candidatus Hypogeohydataceae bacterium YC41]
MNQTWRLWLVILFLIPALSISRGSLGEGKYRVLFDAGHAESAGRHADWIIDDDIPEPMPKNPKSPEEWSGGISSWGYDLYKTGRCEVESTDKPLTFLNSHNPQDLSKFDVLILCEPNKDFDPSERQAIIAFVKEGGGLFLVADHFGSDRNNDGIDSTGIFDKLEKETGIHFQGKGERNASLKGGHSTSNFCSFTDREDNPIFQGPFGAVRKAYLNGFGTIRTLKNFNGTVQGHVWMNGSTQGEQDIIFVTSRLGQGKIAALSDSSPADDGTTRTPGKQLYNGWHAAGAQNNSLILNTTDFLAKHGKE